MEEAQFVIMFNDVAAEVCAQGTTKEQADARAVSIKKEWLERNRWQNSWTITTRAYDVKVFKPTEEQSNG